MKQKIVFVTGVSAGIGRSIADTLLQADMTVIGASRSEPKGTYGFHWIPMDVSDSAQVQAAIDQIGNKYGQLDVLINNAGIGLLSPFEETPSHQWQRLMATNVHGPIYLIQSALPLLRESKGKIITISSLAGVFGLPYRSFYTASKFSIEGITQSLRTELRKFDIQICTLCPGAVKSDINANRGFVEGVLPAYRDELVGVSRSVNQSIVDGIPLKQVSQKVLKIINQRRIRPRYLVAAPLQKAAPLIKRFLGSNLFEKMLMRANGM